MTASEILQYITQNGVAVVFVVLMWIERQKGRKEEMMAINDLQDAIRELQLSMTEKLQQTLEVITAQQEENNSILEIIKDRSERK